MSNTNGSATPAALGSSAYSFYLNVVVLEHHVDAPSTPSTLDQVEEAHKEEEDEVNLAPAAVTADSSPQKQKTPSSEQKRTSLLSALSRSDLDKSLHNIGRAVSHTSSTFRNKGAAFVASKTMVNRALTALAKSLPDLAFASEDLELTIDKRFHQGRVIVLQVDLKATAMPRYVEEILGEEAADHYRSAMQTLTLLQANETMSSLEHEMLPKVRQGLMDKLKDTLLKTLKAKDDLLEVDCIALEEAEEARWLFTYMEFQEQMK